MGIRIDGASDLINATDGSLTIEGQSVNTTGIVTASGGFKVGTAATIYSTGNATFSGIVTASNTTISSTGIGIGAETNGSASYPSVTISGTSGGAIHFEDDGDLMADIYGDASGLTLSTRKTSDAILFQLNSGSVQEKARFDSNGRLLIGATSVDPLWGISAALAVEGTSGNASAINIVRNSNDGSSPYLTFGKSRGTSVGSNTVVQSGDSVGTIAFTAADGTDKAHSAAYIQAQIDGTPGGNDLPGRIIFATTADGSASSTERLRITSAGKVCIGGDSPATATLNINTTSHYVVTDSGRAANGIHIRGNGGNSGEYGGGISFGCNSTGAAAIAAEQMSSDVDVIGLSFFTRSSSTGSDDAVKRVRIPSNGGIELHNWPSNTGFIFRSDASPPTTATVQNSGGRGMCSGIVNSIAQNTATTLGNTHWGGLALIGYEGTGHQGYRLVAYGYGGAGVSVLFSGQWVGSLTTTFTMSTYNLQVSHNSSNNLNFWLINLGV